MNPVYNNKGQDGLTRTPIFEFERSYLMTSQATPLTNDIAEIRAEINDVRTTSDGIRQSIEEVADNQYDPEDLATWIMEKIEPFFYEAGWTQERHLSPSVSAAQLIEWRSAGYKYCQALISISFIISTQNHGHAGFPVESIIAVHNENQRQRAPT